MSNFLHVEVCQDIDSLLSNTQIEELVKAELNLMQNVLLDVTFLSESFDNKTLKNHVQSIYCSYEHTDKSVIFEQMDTQFHIYRLNEEEVAIESMQDGEMNVSAATHWILPSAKFHGLWENLFYDADIKENLINFAETAITYSERKVNPHIISWNKVILLHGPPGTGKTSLCKALAQKITIRLGKQFDRGELIEINSHSLFSKWFSESGKLVKNLFDEIKILLEDSSAFVCILIDEIESLAHARDACKNGSDPSDSIRVVNTLLTQLDSIKCIPNVLILTTSNLTEAIDLAFIDRADIKLYISLPKENAIYNIYFNSIKELIRTEFINVETCLETELLKIEESKQIYTLNYLCLNSLGISGRTLKKIPFLTHSLFRKKLKDKSLLSFLTAMNHTIKWELNNVLGRPMF